MVQGHRKNARAPHVGIKWHGHRNFSMFQKKCKGSASGIKWHGHGNFPNFLEKVQRLCPNTIEVRLSLHLPLLSGPTRILKHWDL